ARRRRARLHAPAAHARGRGAPHARRRPAAALGPGPRARGAHREDDRRARAGRRRRGRARGRGARVPLAAGARRVNELALAVYASESGRHLVEPPFDRRWGAHLRSFDANTYERRLAEQGIRFVPRAQLPPLLRAIHDPPPGLFLRGRADPDVLARPAVAIVGARACSGYGASVARSLGRELARAGLVVVSGLAELARRIAETGLVVSEYAPGVEPAPWRFPARNRIVAGLCGAAVVVEARERSGALITADFAVEEGREVFAVPGEITSSLSAGTHALLKLGASPLT